MTAEGSKPPIGKQTPSGEDGITGGAIKDP